MKARGFGLTAAAVCGAAVAALAAPQATPEVPLRRPAAVVDLMTEAGVRLMHGAWRYHGASVVDVDHRAPGADLKPSGPPNRTQDIEPHAGVASFDDSAWPIIAPETLTTRRGNGRLSFNWYRFSFTVPAKVGTFDPTGSSLVFEIVVDDYAEVWVNGRLPLALGQTGGPAIKGWNAPNRVLLGRDVRPGQQFQIAVFAANGPLSAPPPNYVWIRSATLDFHRAADAAGDRTPLKITRLDPALDAIVPADARIERLATGFTFTEGPAWSPEGDLLFSDPNDNVIYRYAPDGQVSVFRTKSGYAGTDIGDYRQPGSNGLAFDADGRLTIAQHGARRIVRIEKNGVVTVLADRYQGRRLNSPNDLVYKSDGALYFTDPPFGLPKVFDDPRKELAQSGVYRVKDGVVTLLAADFTGPNGLAFSPDERYLYVGNWDDHRKVVMRYPVKPDGTLEAGAIFLDVTTTPGEDAIDGVKVDRVGNVYVSGPGGLWIVAPDGRRLGAIDGPEHPHNMAFGDADGRSLYLTARTGLYRVRLNVAGR